MAVYLEKIPSDYLDRFLNKRLGIRCRTEDNAKTLFRMLNEHKVTWSGGGILEMSRTRWGSYKEGTVYIHASSGVMYGTLSGAVDCGIREYIDFDKIPQFKRESI